jgi:hypothetical protein
MYACRATTSLAAAPAAAAPAAPAAAGPKRDATMMRCTDKVCNPAQQQILPAGAGLGWTTCHSGNCTRPAGPLGEPPCHHLSDARAPGCISAQWCGLTRGKVAACWHGKTLHSLLRGRLVLRWCSTCRSCSDDPAAVSTLQYKAVKPLLQGGPACCPWCNVW